MACHRRLCCYLDLDRSEAKSRIGDAIQAAR
jgi:hypothetical protein